MNQSKSCPCLCRRPRHDTDSNPLESRSRSILARLHLNWELSGCSSQSLGFNGGRGSPELPARRPDREDAIDERLQFETLYAIGAATKEKPSKREHARNMRRRTLTKQMNDADLATLREEFQAAGGTDEAKLAIFAASRVVLRKKKPSAKRRASTTRQSAAKEEPATTEEPLPQPRRRLTSNRSRPSRPQKASAVAVEEQNSTLRRKALAGTHSPPMKAVSLLDSTGIICAPPVAQVSRITTALDAVWIARRRFSAVGGSLVGVTLLFVVVLSTITQN